MPHVTVRLPGLLASILSGRSTVSLEAGTIRGALDELVRLNPALGVHLFDESGSLRRHVLCFHNQTNTRWLDGLSAPLAEGDVITIMQAVSGG